MFRIRRSRFGKFILPLMIAASLVLVGCIGPRGWPGAASEGDILYVGSMQGNVLALNISSGAQVWKFTPVIERSAGSLFACGGGSAQTMAGKLYANPVVANQTVYIGVYTGDVYAIVGGTEEWKFNASSPVVGSLVLGDGALYFGTSDGKLHALDIRTGEPRQGFNIFETKGKIWSTPAFSDGVIYVGSLDHDVYAVDAQTGTEKWVFPTEGGIGSTPLVANGTVYIGSFTNQFYALDAQTGSQKWVFEQAKNWFWSQPVLAEGIIYAGSLDGNLYALNAESGELLWSFHAGDSIKASPVMSEGAIIVASENGNVYGLDPLTGSEKWNVAIGESKILADLYAAKGVVFVNAQNNRLYALDANTGHQEWSVGLSD